MAKLTETLVTASFGIAGALLLTSTARSEPNQNCSLPEVMASLEGVVQSASTLFKGAERPGDSPPEFAITSQAAIGVVDDVPLCKAFVLIGSMRANFLCQVLEKDDGRNQIVSQTLSQTLSLIFGSDFFKAAKAAADATVMEFVDSAN